jgi:hypothetical protein
VRTRLPHGWMWFWSVCMASANPVAWKKGTVDAAAAEMRRVARQKGWVTVMEDPEAL